MLWHHTSSSSVVCQTLLLPHLLDYSVAALQAYFDISPPQSSLSLALAAVMAVGSTYSSGLRSAKCMTINKGSSINGKPHLCCILPTMTTHSVHNNDFVSPEPTNHQHQCKSQMQRQQHPNNNDGLQQDSEQWQGSAQLQLQAT
ncbi:hypothetical protein EDB83DRAFT_2315970 [Lactarius deliciosus]|nr:hypothetical protein EDB83DRAFT_2315970 [Lactarius deliciosus]